MTAPIVSSRQHPFVQQCRRLATGRGDAGQVLLDGAHLVQDALDAGVPLLGALADERGRPLFAALHAHRVPLHLASRAAVDAASPVRTPGGIVAIAQWSPSEVAPLLEAPAALLVGLAGIQDPGNVGNIIRSAEALGATGVLALDGTADPAGWKALRGAMGSTFRLPVAVGDTDGVLASARARGVRVVATVAAGGDILGAVPLTPPVLVLVGSEGAGLPPAIVASADVRITVPMRGRNNSLNAATTAAIVLWELARARSTAATQAQP